MVLSLRQAGLISTSIQAILYGAAVVMYILTIWILLQRERRRNINRKMIIAACALFLFATAEMIVNIVRISEGFVSVGPNLPGGPEQYFQNAAEPTIVIKNVLYNIQTLILDGVVIYRTYVVWQSIFPVLVPIFGWFGLLAAVIAMNAQLLQARSGNRSGELFVGTTGEWVTASFSATLATNLSASGLLAYRIWTLNRSVASVRLQSQLGLAGRAVVESGLIYSLTITSALITFVVKSPGVYVILDMISPIILITFCMMIVRIGMAQHSTLNATSMRTSRGTHGAVEHDLSNRRATLQGSRHHELYDMKPLAVEVTQFRAVKTDVGTESVYPGSKRGGGPERAETDDMDMQDVMEKSISQ